MRLRRVGATSHEDTIGAIAGQVGHGSAFALSGAFKRVYGVSPQEHRTRSA